MISDAHSQAERIEVLKLLFAVGGADGTISSEEEHIIGSIAEGLALTRKDFLSARSEFLDQLESIQQLGKKG